MSGNLALVTRSPLNVNSVCESEEIMAEERSHLESVTGEIKETLTSVVSTLNTMQTDFQIVRQELKHHEKDTSGAISRINDDLKEFRKELKDAISRLSTLEKTTLANAINTNHNKENQQKSDKWLYKVVWATGGGGLVGAITVAYQIFQNGGS